MKYRLTGEAEQMLSRLPAGAGLIVFDSFCVLCSSVVRFLIRADKEEKLYFASFDTQAGRELSRSIQPGGSQANLVANSHYNEHSSQQKSPDNEYPIYDSAIPDSLIFVKNGNLWLQSEAVIQILLMLRYPWKSLVIIKYIPYSIREALYRFIARTRYKIFPPKTSCALPEEKVRKRFV